MQSKHGFVVSVFSVVFIYLRFVRNRFPKRCSPSHIHLANTFLIVRQEGLYNLFVSHIVVRVLSVLIDRCPKTAAFVYCVVLQGKSNLFSVKKLFFEKRLGCFLWAAKSFVIDLPIWGKLILSGAFFRGGYRAIRAMQPSVNLPRVLISASYP